MDKPWKVIFAFVGVFIAGAVFGGLLSLRIGRSIIERRERLQPLSAESAQAKVGQRPPLRQQLPLGLQAQSAGLMRRFAEHLDLTPEQRDRVMPLIQRATADFRRQRQTQFREDTLVLQRLQEDIRKELRPGQIAKLDKMEERQRQILEQRQRDEQFQRGEPGPAGNNPRPELNNPGFNPNNPNQRGPNQRGPNQPMRPGPGPQRPFPGQPGPNQPGQFQPGGPNGPGPQGQSNPPPEPPPKGPPPPGSGGK